jgi:integrase
MRRDEQRRKVVRVTEESFAAVLRGFMSSSNPRWVKYSDATRDLWGRELLRAGRPDCLGAVTVDQIRPALVQAYIDGIAGSPGKQAAAYAALKQVEKWAVVRDLLPRPITTGVEFEDGGGGHIPWTEEQVALAEQQARPDLARVITLGANTGQRGSDLIRMGPTDIETFNGTDGIRIVQKKTGREVWIPIASPLAAAMATWGRRPGPFLVKPDGSPWTRVALSNTWVWHRDRNPALAPLKSAGLVLHGLRAHACVRLLRAGANTRQISDMIGMSEPMVKNYTRFSDQQQNASAAVFHMERTIRERAHDKIDRKAW